MIIDGKQNIKVEIDDYTARQVAIEAIRKLFDFDEEYYIDWERGVVMQAEEIQLGAHDTIERTTVRKATDNDMAADRMIRQLKKGKVE